MFERIAIHEGYLKNRFGVGGVRRSAEPTEPKQPKAVGATDAFDRPIDDVRRVACCVKHGR